MKTTIARALRSLPLVALLASITTGEARADDDKKSAPPATVAASASDEASQRFRSGVSFYKDND